MREALVSVLALLAVASPGKSSEIGKDGFNFYKDYVRGRSDDVVPESSPEERIVYYYRTPLSLYPSLLPAIEQDYKKRTGNVYKNHMLSKDQWDGSAVPSKRSSKAALSFLMQGKHPIFAKILERISSECKVALSLRKIGALYSRFRDDGVSENSVEVPMK